MLVSHRKKFIFLKTTKTAGTSIEIYLERYCLPADHKYVMTRGRKQTVTPAGIIGYRGSKRAGATYYNHISAGELKALIGAETWDSYCKISCIRNPYDRMVSMFWFRLPEDERERLKDQPFDRIKERFAKFLIATTGSPSRNSNILRLDGELAVDMVIRYENLLSDLESVCLAIDIPFEPERLGQFKSGSRLLTTHFSEYYSEETASIVAEACRFELETFGYTLHGGAPGEADENSQSLRRA